MTTRTPEEALDLYLDARKPEVAPSTIQAHRYRLNHFVGWCDDQGIDTLDELEPTHMHEYRVWRRADGDLSVASEKTQMDTLRVFIRWCGRLEYVDENLSEAVVSPELTSEENSRDVIVADDEAEAILSRLDRYEYASRDHAVFTLLREVGMRACSVHSLDLGDINHDENLIELEHRPETGTRLKNGSVSERYVAISDTTVAILSDYIDENRLDKTDDNGRKPLFTTQRGRMSKNSLRSSSYRETRPCVWDGDCPHGKNIMECKAALEGAYAYECPSSKSPHAWRRGAITHMLSEDVPPEIVSDRADVSESVIEQHYDGRDELTKVEQRRDYLDNL